MREYISVVWKLVAAASVNMFLFPKLGLRRVHGLAAAAPVCLGIAGSGQKCLDQWDQRSPAGCWKNSGPLLSFPRPQQVPW